MSIETRISPGLIILSAPSGAGKTTLCRKLLEEYKRQLVLSISSTTRSPRGKETHGKDYYFLSEEDFKRQIHDHQFAEWAQVHQHYYGTSKGVIDQTLSTNRFVLLDIDVQGAYQLKKTYPRQSVLIFVSPPNLMELEKRLKARGTESKEKIQTRLQHAQLEMEERSKFDYILMNDSLEHAYQELIAILRSCYPATF